MSALKDVKERGLDMNYRRYMELTTSDEHPYGILPVSGNASEEKVAEWQAEFDRTGKLSPEYVLTADENNLAKWITYSEEAAEYNRQNKDVPKSLNNRARKVWADDFRFKEPKKDKRRKLTIQMFLSLPPALAESVGHDVGLLWRTADDPMSVEAIGALVAETFPETRYKEKPVERARVDIRKHNNGVFPCMREGDTVYKPDEQYPENYDDPDNVPKPALRGSKKKDEAEVLAEIQDEQS